MMDINSQSFFKKKKKKLISLKLIAFTLGD